MELKRLQIRAGRANEHILVKRLSDEYAKNIVNFVGLRKHDGPFTFKEFEKYLYGKTKTNKRFVTCENISWTRRHTHEGIANLTQLIIVFALLIYVHF